MTIYFDTGILLKLYSAEADSAKAIALVQRFGSPICFTDLQDAELRNALYRKNARNEISRQELRKARLEVASPELPAAKRIDSLSLCDVASLLDFAG